MNEFVSRVPPPRPALTDPNLTRPNWTSTAARQDDPLWLDKNENLDPAMHALARRVVAELPDTALWTYPDPGAVYAKLSGSTGLTEQELLLTTGADGVIRTVFEAYVNPGDAVVITSPTFAMYPIYCKIFGAQPCVIEYRRNGKGPELGLDELINTVKRVQPRLVCLPNPDSPTGSVMANADLEALLDACEAVGSLLLVDEAYYPFHDETLLDQVSQRPNLVVARTFSKAWALAGLRIGFAAACEPLCAYLHKTRPMYELGALAIAVLKRMLDHDREMHASVARVLEGKSWFEDTMRNHGFDVTATKGNFLHVAFREHASTVHAALEGRVLYRPEFTQHCLAGYSRFTAAPQPLMQTVAGYITQALAQKDSTGQGVAPC